ncbi:MAG: hypothetical protein M3297_04880 [Thermoproteota archaeon]|nr:hypothetical protein [Thermoproteota archaeon]
MKMRDSLTERGKNVLKVARRKFYKDIPGSVSSISIWKSHPRRENLVPWLPYVAQSDKLMERDQDFYPDITDNIFKLGRL